MHAFAMTCKHHRSELLFHTRCSLSLSALCVPVLLLIFQTCGGSGAGCTPCCGLQSTLWTDWTQSDINTPCCMRDTSWSIQTAAGSYMNCEVALMSLSDDQNMLRHCRATHLCTDRSSHLCVQKMWFIFPLTLYVRLNWTASNQSKIIIFSQY